MNYVTYGILGLVLGTLSSAMLLGLVKGYVDASNGITEYDPETMNPLLRIFAPLGTLAGGAAGAGLAAWKQKR